VRALVLALVSALAGACALLLRLEAPGPIPRRRGARGAGGRWVWV